MNSPTPVTVRTPSDLLACVPLMLGFLPQDSAVLISLPPGAGPHARADLDAGTDLDDLAHALLAPVLRHEVARVALVTYGPLLRARQAAVRLHEVFVGAGIEVVAVVAADGTHWISFGPGEHETTPREYDALAHPFVTEAVVEGQVVLGSRGAVRDQLAADPDLVRQVDALLGHGRAEAPVVPVAPQVSPAWAVECLRRHVQERTLPEASEIARLLRAVEETPGRDAAWAWAEKQDARHHVEIWLRVLRGCTPPGRSAAAAILAFHAWLAGDGALAWCAVEASQASGTPCSLASLVEDLLQEAATPRGWVPLMHPDQGGSRFPDG